MQEWGRRGSRTRHCLTKAGEGLLRAEQELELCGRPELSWLGRHGAGFVLGVRCWAHGIVARPWSLVQQLVYARWAHQMALFELVARGASLMGCCRYHPQLKCLLAPQQLGRHGPLVWGAVAGPAKQQQGLEYETLLA